MHTILALKIDDFEIIVNLSIEIVIETESLHHN